MDIRRLIGENIRLRREAARLSQEELAARVGVEQSYISGLAAGRRNPTVMTLWHVAMALKTNPADLFATTSTEQGLRGRRGRPRKA